MSTDTDLANLFASVDGTCFLTHSVGCPPLNAWTHDGADVWPSWLQGIETFRNDLAVLLNDSSKNFCPQKLGVYTFFVSEVLTEESGKSEPE